MGDEIEHSIKATRKWISREKKIYGGPMEKLELN